MMNIGESLTCQKPSVLDSCANSVWRAAVRSSVQSGKVYRFGVFEAHESSGELFCRGSLVRLQAQPFRLLIILLEQAGKVIPREQLRQKLWASDTYVEFDGSLNNALKKLRAALRDSAETPVFIETLPRRGYRFLAPVTVEERSADTPAVELTEENETSPVRSAAESRGISGRRLALLAALFVLIVSISVASYRRISAARERTRLAAQPQPVRSRLSVAVLGFSNTSRRPQDAWLSTGLSEMLTSELEAGEQLRMVSAEEVEQLNRALPLGQPGTLSKSTLVLIHRLIGADVVVVGSYSSLGTKGGEEIRLDLHLQETAEGDTIATVTDSSTQSGLFRMVSRVGSRLRERLAVPEISADQAASVQASLPANADAERWYAEGLTKLRLFDALGARDALEHAIHADPAYALAHSALAEAWSQLGYEQKAKSEAKRAFELSDKLPRKDRLFVEARYRSMNHEWDKALELYQALFDFFPDDIEYGLHLAKAQTQDGKKDAASATIQSLRRLPAPGRDDARIDLAEEFNDTLSGQHKLAHQAATRAIEKARANGRNLLLAQALYRDASALAFLGEGDKAMAAANESKSIYAAAGDQFGVSAALVSIGKAQWLQGKYEVSEKFFQQALVADQNIGNKSGAAFDLRFLAAIHAMRGELNDARRLYEQALASYREVDDQEHVAYTLNEIAWVDKSDGNPRAALQKYDESLVTFQNLQDDEGAGVTLDERGNVLVMLGELDEARADCEQALALFRKGGSPNRITRALFDLGNIDSLQDRLDDARQAFSEALAIDRKTGDGLQAVTVELGLAEVTEEQGHRAEAKQQINESLDFLHQHRDPNNEVNAEGLLAEIALADGDVSGAVHHMDIAHGLLKKDQGWTERYIFEIQNARVEAANGKFTQAGKSLHGVLAEAQKHDYVHYELEARLALCELEAKTAPAVARAHELALEKDARERGFGMILRKSLALRNRIG